MYSMFFKESKYYQLHLQVVKHINLLNCFNTSQSFKKKKNEMKRKALQPYNSKNLWVNYDVKQTGNNSSVEII